MISNCGHDERNKYTGGKAGDQTGEEWKIREWYDKPWNCVLRHPDPKIREMIADKAEKAAKNDYIGYDMNQRYTFWEVLRTVADYDPAKITTPCEADCSSGVTAIVRAIGFQLGITKLQNIPEKTYTEDMKENFVKAGFNVLTAKKYTKSQDDLLRGDILLNYTKHVTTNLTDGKNVGEIQNEPKLLPLEEIAKLVYQGKYGNDPERSKKLKAEGYDPKEVQAKVNELYYSKPAKKTTTYEIVNLETFLNVRATPNGTVVGKLYNGNKVEVVSISGKWAKLNTGNYIYTDYIKKV